MLPDTIELGSVKSITRIHMTNLTLTTRVLRARHRLSCLGVWMMGTSRWLANTSSKKRRG